MTNVYNVQYSSEAVDDLREIYAYIANELLSPDVAKNLIRRILSAIRKLDFMPNRHPLVGWEPWHSLGMRLLPVNNFNVYYLVNTAELTVLIVRIFYSGRDIENLI